MVQTAYSRQSYREQEVMGASPLHLVVMAYDVAIQACEQKNLARATQAVSLLRDSLNFDYGEAATGLFRLYQWTLDCVRNDNYSEALKVLRELRVAWATVEKRLSPSFVDVTQGVTIAAGL
jgi:flagellin-specific chaperone FliS